MLKTLYCYSWLCNCTKTLPIRVFSTRLAFMICYWGINIRGHISYHFHVIFRKSFLVSMQSDWLTIGVCHINNYSVWHVHVPRYINQLINRHKPSVTVSNQLTLGGPVLSSFITMTTIHSWVFAYQWYLIQQKLVTDTSPHSIYVSLSTFFDYLV